MKIDNTSMFFNATIKDGTATAAWGTAAGQSQKNGYKINTDVDGLSDVLIGMNYKIKTDFTNLDISAGSKSRELLLFSVFDKVFINNDLLDNVSFILLLVKEHSSSHDGRIIISYPTYASYKSGSLVVNNLDAMKKMASKLKCPTGCWFVHDISVKNQDELHFTAVVVDKSSVEYKSSQERKTEWDNLVELAAFKSIPQIPFNYKIFKKSTEDSGLFFSDQLIQRFIASLCTKQFVICSGLSGSGKTKLAQAFAQWICQDESQYRIIPVGADWTNREPLLGYPNALNPQEYVKPDSGVLDLIILANNQPDLPHFLILDEMNLSHVERYFADFLSVMESKEEIPLYAEGTVENGVPPKLKVPSNLFIIGTVNIDETTNMFSPKVLDRANTIEFSVTQYEMKNFLSNIKDINMDALTGKGSGMAKSFLEMATNKDFTTIDIAEINAALVRFFGELKKTGAEFGYRSATEILRLINQLTVLDDKLTTNQKIDIAIIQKLLPKLHGSRRKLCPVLETLGSFCINGDIKIIKDVFEKADFDFNGGNVLYPLSLEKITRMYRGAIDNGFASFAEA